MIQKISNGVYVVPYKKNAAVVSWGKDASEVVDAAIDTKDGRPKGTSDHIERANKDAQLLELHQLACDNPSKWQLIYTKSDFTAGGGLGIGITEIKNGEEVLTPILDTQISNWIEKLNLEDLRAGAAMQLAFAEEIFARLALNSDGTINDISIIDVFDIRAKKIEKGSNKITKWVINPNFGTRRFKKADNIYLDAFDPKDPKKYAVSVIHIRRPNIPGQKIYSLAPWWGTANWTSVSNKVPVYNNKGLDNGYFVTHHISIPNDYFDDLIFESEEEQEAYKIKVMDSMSDTVSGYENPNKVLFTYHKTDGQGREMPGVKINPLKNTINDEAFVKLFQTATNAQAQGHGLPPALAGIETGGKLGGSGKELEASANYLQDFLSLEHRRLIMKLIRYCQIIDDIDLSKKIYIKRIKTYTYDVTPTKSTDNPNNPANQNASV